MESRLDIVSLMAVVRLAAVLTLGVGAFMASHTPEATGAASLAAAGPALMLEVVAPPAAAEGRMVVAHAAAVEH